MKPDKMVVSGITLSFILSGYLHAHGQNPITKSYLELLPIDTFVDTLSLEELSELVVTDTKIAQSSRSVTQNTLIINHTEFERLTDNNRNIAELLRYTSGQFVNVLSRNDANWGSYAGLGPKYNTYMLDGLPIDSFADAMSLDPWAFERVEIQKGPASVLYSNYMSMDFAGNESPLAGTTNFILKEKIDHPMTRLQTGIGSYGTLNAKAYHQDTNGKLGYFIGGNIEKSDYTQYGENGSWLQTVEKADYVKAKLYGKAVWNFGTDHSLSLFFHHTAQTGDLGRPNRNFDHRYHTLNVKYRAPLSEALDLQFQGGLRDYHREFENDNYPATLEYTNSSLTRQSIVPVDLSLSYRHGEGSVLTFGSDAQWANYTTSRKSDGTTVKNNDVNAFSNGFFLQEKASLGDWILRAGIRHNRIRHDYNLLSGVIPVLSESSWNQTLWNVGIRWNANETFSWYANAGTGFMTPSAKQVGGTVINTSTDSGQLPNASLQSELGRGNDMGIEYRPNPAMLIGIRAFYNRINDAIVDNVANTYPSQTLSINAGKAVAKGVEIDFQNKPGGDIEYFANATYTDSQVKDPSNSQTDGSEIPFVPSFVANLGITALLPWEITGSGYVQQVGKYYDSSSKTERTSFGNYQTFNARFQKNVLRSADNSVTATVDLNNIGDKRYSMPWGFVDPGFNAMASVQISF